MSTTSPRPERSLGETWWYWLWFLLLGIPPRVIILAFWAFGSQLGDAYDSWVIPAVGFFIAPSTTLAYAMVWSASDGVEGAGWLVVGFAAILDVVIWGLVQRIRAR